MAYVYRYVDNEDGLVKYVGIVWSDGRTLWERLTEHCNDDWYEDGRFRIDALEMPIESRTDAEYIESRFIAKYGTDKWYNKAKSGWGESKFIQIDETDWKPVDLNRLKAENDLERQRRLAAKDAMRPVDLWNTVLLSPKFQSLTASAQVLYICMTAESCGYNQFVFPHVASKKYGISGTTFDRCLCELRKAGLISCVGTTERNMNIYSFGEI